MLQKYALCYIFHFGSVSFLDHAVESVPSTQHLRLRGCFAPPGHDCAGDKGPWDLWV